MVVCRGCLDCLYRDMTLVVVFLNTSLEFAIATICPSGNTYYIWKMDGCLDITKMNRIVDFSSGHKRLNLLSSN